MNNEVIKVNIPHELDFQRNEIMGEQTLKTVIPQFTEEQEPFYFEKEERVKRTWNILSTNNGGYWLGTAYYNIRVGKDIFKMKRIRASRSDKNIIEINRNVFQDNKYFVLINGRGDKYFIKEKGY